MTIGVYLIVINVYGLLIFGIDKRKAKKEYRRITEKHLLTVAFLGGRIGCYIGMSKFRHKTKKNQFLVKFYGIAVLWILIIIGRLTKKPIT